MSQSDGMKGRPGKYHDAFLRDLSRAVKKSPRVEPRFHPCRDADGVIRCPRCGWPSPCPNYRAGCP